MKTCTRCKESKDHSQFGPQKRTKDGLNYWCKLCKRADSQAWREKHKGYGTEWARQNKEKQWAAQIKSHYGITPAQYEEMYRAQGGSCAICKKAETVVDGRNICLRKLAVDHDHGTGKVRGLLCYVCNTTLGRINEDFDTAISLAKYIQEHKGII